jgi:hypothetical protein
MIEESTIIAATKRLQQYIELHHYTGYDPYDALKSPFFRWPILNKNKLIRFGAQQLVKRSPINLRPLLFVPKGKNPVTLGLCIQGYAQLIAVMPELKDNLTEKIKSLIAELKQMIPSGFHGACWGYDFDWEARYANIPAYQPTVVATGIITNALFIAWQITGLIQALDLCKSATHFVLNDLQKTSDNEGNICFSYSPFDKQVVFNASMKGARLLAQVYSVTKEEALASMAKKAVLFVMKYQRNDGSWTYSTSDAGTWIDNYHTGYVLDCLHDYILYCNDHTLQKNLTHGFTFYKNHFFEHNQIPKFYNHQIFPVDCTAAAQSLLTLTRFSEQQTAIQVANYMIENMQHPSGYFYFRKYASHTEKTSFMRWSNAWMFAGLTALLKKLSER